MAWEAFIGSSFVQYCVPLTRTDKHELPTPVNTAQLPTVDNERTLGPVIKIKHDYKKANVVNIGDGLVIMRRFEATVEQDDILQWGAERSSSVRVSVEWNDAGFTYEIRSLTVLTPADAEPVTGTTLRAIPVQWILKMCITRALYMKSEEKRGAQLVSLHNQTVQDEGQLLRLGKMGPQPETLEWVSRIYTLAKIKLDPPAQYVADAFEVPLRTASHWIKLARERGHLSV